MDVIGNILGKNYKKNDWDLDGVKNKKDCQPRNPMRQDNIRVGDEVRYVGPALSLYGKGRYIVKGKSKASDGTDLLNVVDKKTREIGPTNRGDHYKKV